MFAEIFHQFLHEGVELALLDIHILDFIQQFFDLHTYINMY
jgi:hypothetical protein